MGRSHSPQIVTNGLLLSLDFANPKNYISGTSANTSINPYNCTFKNGATYNTVANGVITFTRAATVTTKANDGGGVYTPALPSPLAGNNFLYNDFSWEIWFKINDRNPSNFDANEQSSAIAMYKGYNSGFEYNASTLRFSVWDGITAGYTASSWTVGTTSQQVIQGNWYQIAVTKSGSTFTPYLNGAQVGTGNTVSISNTNSGVANLLGIGSVNAANFIWYSKMDFSNMKMYNRTLSLDEIKQNFNAHRGRFGL